MGRAPCCEKMGLKKGPWTPEEDHILVTYINKFGHGNWRALPKQAGLLRCGKSCRLRWVNYLRPDIKRGNFTKEEEETIISLHQMLGNRWSAIAARLPGRTDNEIKNVWHTHLKKRTNFDTETQEPKKRTKCSSKSKKESESATAQLDTDSSNTTTYANSRLTSMSPEQSCSELSTSASDSSTMTAEVTNRMCIKEESEEFLDTALDETFWAEALSMNNSSSKSFAELELSDQLTDTEAFPSASSVNYNDMDFWLKVFTDAGGLQDLPEI